ncbi:MAG: hypothetical protein AB7N91_31905 [Candidatus Tectimicrobiota bacterium]
MHLWHLTPDTLRIPAHVNADTPVQVYLGTYPIAPGQATWVEWQVRHADDRQEAGQAPGVWQHNSGPNSYWVAQLGPFHDGDRVSYRPMGQSPEGSVQGEPAHFRVGPELAVALMWHQHQPCYKNLQAAQGRGAYRLPWVRLQTLRTYYMLAARLAAYPTLHVSLSCTPMLLWQLQDYVNGGGSDRALDLTLTPARRLSSARREELLENFFEADWHSQIFPHARYAQLFAQRQAGEPFSLDDLTDLQMWFNLAWFAPAFQTGEVALPDGSVASVKRFVDQASGYSRQDIQAMVEEQYTILRNVIPLYRTLQEQEQLEIVATPFTQPALPLFYETPAAQSVHSEAPAPADAQEQLARALAFYQTCFGRPARGMWLGEGVLAQPLLPLFQHTGLHWLASDPGPLADPQGASLDQTPAPDETDGVEDSPGQPLHLVVRHAALSEQLRVYGTEAPDVHQAVEDLLQQLKAYAAAYADARRRPMVSLIVPGEALAGSQPAQTGDFLTALYEALCRDPTLQTVTVTEYLRRHPGRQVAPQIGSRQAARTPLSAGAAPELQASSVVATRHFWLGQAAQHQAWTLLQQARHTLEQRQATPSSAPRAFASLLAAQDSAWLLSLGEAEPADHTTLCEHLFRQHLANVYRALGTRVPRPLQQSLLAPVTVWTVPAPCSALGSGERLVIRANAPTTIHWGLNDDVLSRVEPLRASRDGWTPLQDYRITLGPFDAAVQVVRFRLTCGTQYCSGTTWCCSPRIHAVHLSRAYS